MEIYIYNTVEINGKYQVTFKYWKKGECACSAIKKTAQFDYEPSKKDLINCI